MPIDIHIRASSLDLAQRARSSEYLDRCVVLFSFAPVRGRNHRTPRACLCPDPESRSVYFVRYRTLVRSLGAISRASPQKDKR
jgi:hypothetical protein